RADIIGGEREEVSAEAGDEQEKNCPQQSREHLINRSRSDVATVVALGSGVMRGLGIARAKRMGFPRFHWMFTVAGFGRLLHLNRYRRLGMSTVLCPRADRRFDLRTLCGALDEDPGDIVDRGPIDEWFDQFRGCAQESQQNDDQA